MFSISFSNLYMPRNSTQINYLFIIGFPDQSFFLMFYMTVSEVAFCDGLVGRRLDTLNMLPTGYHSSPKNKQTLPYLQH